jgi:hypothetical protein
MGDKMDLTVLLWILGGGFAINFALLTLLWKFMCGRFDKIDSKFDAILNEVKELRTSINRMEGAFYNKDCCMLKNDHNIKKAE